MRAAGASVPALDCIPSRTYSEHPSLPSPSRRRHDAPGRAGRPKAGPENRPSFSGRIPETGVADLPMPDARRRRWSAGRRLLRYRFGSHPDGTHEGAFFGRNSRSRPVGAILGVRVPPLAVAARQEETGLRVPSRDAPREIPSGCEPGGKARRRLPALHRSVVVGRCSPLDPRAAS